MHARSDRLPMPKFLKNRSKFDSEVQAAHFWPNISERVNNTTAANDLVIW